MRSQTTVQESRFLKLVEDYDGRFRRIAHVYASRSDADDLLQDIWLQIWRSLPGFDGAARLDTWAYRIALNTALSHRRRARPQADTLDEHADRALAPTAGDPAGILEDFAAKLSPVDRAVLLLHLDDHRAEDSADILGMSRNAVSIRLTRIRQQFESRYVED